MDFSLSKLYGIGSKKYLKVLLGKRFLSNKMLRLLAQSYTPFICKNGKPRLVEAPSECLKGIQKKINTYLYDFNLPRWLMSKKGSGYINNAKVHLLNNYILTIDINKFYPNCHREYIYRFFHDTLRISESISAIITDLTTINLADSCYLKYTDVHEYMNQKGLTCYNHLPSGAPTSPILSFLAYNEMFQHIKNLCDNLNITFTLYVDDMTFSKNSVFNRKFIQDIKKILYCYGHTVSMDKLKLYKANEFKRITGVGISRNKITVLNKHRYAIIKMYHEYLSGEQISIESLLGKIRNTQLIEPHIFSNIKNIIS